MNPTLRRWGPVALVPLLTLLALALLVRNTQAVIDEGWYLPVLEEFTRGWDRELFRNYRGIPASPGQLFFVVYGLWAELAGASLPALRWPSRLLGALAVAALAVWVRRLRGADRRRDAVLALALPYLLLTSQLVMTEPLTVLLTVGSLLAFGEAARAAAGDEESDPATGWWLLSGACLLGALYMRTQLLALGLAQLAALAVARERRALPWAAIAVPLLLRGAGFAFWGGLATEASRALTVAHPSAGFSPTHLGYLLMWAGAFTWPLALRRRPRGRLEVGALVAALVLYLVCLPPFTKPQYMGLTIALRERLGVPPLALALTLTPLAGCAGLGLLRAGQRAWGEPAQRAAFLALLALAGILLGSHHLFDRYLLYAFLCALVLVEAQLPAAEDEPTPAWLEPAWCAFLGGLLALNAVHALHHLR